MDVALFGADMEACLVGCADSSPGVVAGVDACVEEVQAVDSHVHIHIIVRGGDTLPSHNAWCCRCSVPRHVWCRR